MTVGHGQRYLVEREWRDDGRVMQRVNPGEPITEDDWRDVGRWTDADAERASCRRAGWELD